MRIKFGLDYIKNNEKEASEFLKNGEVRITQISRPAAVEPSSKPNFCKDNSKNKIWCTFYFL